MPDPLTHLSISYDTREAFERLARERDLTAATLLRLLVESFIAAHAVGARPSERTPEQRVAEAVARHVQADATGGITVGQAWKRLSSRDRGRGRGVLDAAVELGVEQRLFAVVDTDDGARLLVPATAVPSAT